ncbi:SCO2525 family SAM-dependent methyltransferase [Catellatospora coxensis]
MAGTALEPDHAAVLDGVDQLAAGRYRSELDESGLLDVDGFIDEFDELDEGHYNADFDWDDFNPDSYRTHNYLNLRDDDTEIIRMVGAFFGKFFETPPLAGLRGLDVGSGANLYPTMAMLPFCDAIDLRDFSRSNVAWLKRQVEFYDNHWDAFWDAYGGVPAYARLQKPRHRMRKAARVDRMNIFRLPERAWDIGTMFFVAESLTRDPGEFWQATISFGRALRVGAPFAAAFMADSEGYWVGDTYFPAVAVDLAKVEDCLSVVAHKLTLTMVETDSPLRCGYGGMILATGVAR